MRANIFPFVIACLLGVPQLVSSHTWVEQLNRVASNGTLVSPAGFSNGWPGRQSGAFNDATFTNRIPNEGFTMCKQKPSQQVQNFPFLTAAPGDFVSLRYQENGHVTIPDVPENKPLNRGTVFIYGTTKPKDDASLFDIHRQWTADGKGGDGQGKLLATRNFDDGQCYQINNKPISQQRQAEFPHEAVQPNGGDVWCQSAIQLPEDLAQNSEYTLYWVWSWPTLKASAVANSKNGQFADFPSSFTEDKRAITSDDITTAEIYTSCSVINVQGEKLVEGVKGASSSNQDAGDVAAFSFPAKTDYNINAIKEQLENQFLVKVKGAGDGSGAGNDAPVNSNPAKPNNGTMSSLPAASAPTPTPTGKVRTVTVIAAPVTLYSVMTLTIAPGQTSAPSSAPNQPAVDKEAAQPSITPFLKGRHVRGKDSWNFNQRI